MKKPISEKIKALLTISGASIPALAELFEINAQSMHNKFSRGYFSADDLIKIADACGADLCFEKDGNKIVLNSSNKKTED